MNFTKEQVLNVIKECKQEGLTPEQLFYKKIQKQGIDIQQVNKTLQGLKNIIGRR